ncbi:hypothetical protein cgR_0029 [Corynebacterium glutamicum R]|uniref:Uncharacterized protein n=3 Tax=Corynebacterium glutamicum TaxID=1718 RepID=Q5KSB2_CORGT|nr:flippase [Corynebacterium glutamicum]BAD83872.1 hypothetical protein [Corynebacterium glutamicum]BAF52990.1 hypothetical protein cgR_0029 [Corynebacterium glutamicum R]
MTTAPAQSESRQLFSSSVAMIGGRLVSAGFGWAGSVIIARSLTGDDWGRYSFVFALLGMLEIVTDLGVGRVVLARLTSNDRAETSKIAGSFFVLRAVLGVIGFAIAVGYAWTIGLDPVVMAATMLAGTTVLIATPANALFVLYQSRLKLTYVALFDIAGQAAQFLLIVVVSLFSPTLIMFILPAVVREVIVFACRAFGIPKLLDPEFRPSFREPTAYWGEMLREAIPLSVGFALLHLLERIDMLMLQQMDTFDAVGKYAVGYKFSDLLGLAVSALAIPFTTVLITAWPGKPEVFRARFRQAVLIAALLAGVAVVVFIPSAQAVITLLYGVEFESASLAAILLVVGAGFSGVTYAVVSSLIAAKKLRVFPIIAAAGLILNVVLNLILIPLQSIVGAALATVITESAMLVAMLLVLQWSLKVAQLIPWTIFIRMIIIVGVAVFLFTQLIDINWVLEVVGSLVVFVAVWGVAERKTSAVVVDLIRNRFGTETEPADDH